MKIAKKTTSRTEYNCESYRITASVHHQQPHKRQFSVHPKQTISASLRPSPTRLPSHHLHEHRTLSVLATLFLSLPHHQPSPFVATVLTFRPPPPSAFSLRGHGFHPPPSLHQPSLFVGTVVAKCRLKKSLPLALKLKGHFTPR